MSAAGTVSQRGPGRLEASRAACSSMQGAHAGPRPLLCDGRASGSDFNASARGERTRRDIASRSPCCRQRLAAGWLQRGLRAPRECSRRRFLSRTTACGSRSRRFALLSFATCSAQHSTTDCGKSLSIRRCRCLDASCTSGHIWMRCALPFEVARSTREFLHCSSRRSIADRHPQCARSDRSGSSAQAPG